MFNNKPFINIPNLNRLILLFKYYCDASTKCARIGNYHSKWFMIIIHGFLHFLCSLFFKRAVFVFFFTMDGIMHWQYTAESPTLVFDTILMQPIITYFQNDCGTPRVRLNARYNYICITPKKHSSIGSKTTIH